MGMEKCVAAGRCDAVDSIRNHNMTSLTDKTALIIIDVQEGLDDPVYGRRNNPDAESNMARLLAAWRRRGRPIYHVQHMSTNPDSPLRPANRVTP